MTGQILRSTSGLGPPAAKVPAQLMKMAHGGSDQGGSEMITVVAASSDATISVGRRFMADGALRGAANLAAVLRFHGHPSPLDPPEPRREIEQRVGNPPRVHNHQIGPLADRDAI